MPDWKEIYQQLQQFASLIVSTLKSPSRENAALVFATILFILSHYFIKLLPGGLQEFGETIYGKKIIPGILLAVGLISFIYFIYRKWKLVQSPSSQPITDQPSAIKGAQAFTPADAELFRKLGRENTLKELLGYLEDDQVCLVGLMGKSGAGKTSLLRAGLTDIIKDKNVNYHYWEAVPTDSEQALLRAIKAGWNKNSDRDADNSQPEFESLEYLIKLSSEEFSKSKHIIVIDQFEQLRSDPDGQIFKFFREFVSRAKPPHFITWILSFRSDFAENWLEFEVEAKKFNFRPQTVILPVFSPTEAKNVIRQLIATIHLDVEEKVILNLIEAATVDEKVLSVDIGIGLLILSGLPAAKDGKTITEEDYYFAGEAEGLLTQYIDKCLDYPHEEDRKIVINAMLALRDTETNQRNAEGKTVGELAKEVGTDVRLLKGKLERLTERDRRLLEPVVSSKDETRFRLQHERLIPALNRLAGKLLGELEETKQKFESAFLAWKKDNTWRNLLKRKDFLLVERYKSQIPWGKNESEKLKFIKLSRRKQLFQVFISGILISALVAIGLYFFFLYLPLNQNEYLYDAYPQELANYQKQLKILDLTSRINLNQFPWLCSNALEELRINADFSTTSLDDFAIQLSKCPSLKKLDLDLSLTKVKSLEPLTKLTNLTHLNLNISGPSYKDVIISDLEPLTRLPNLTFLSLDFGEGGISDLEPLTKLSDNTYLNLITSQTFLDTEKILFKMKNRAQLSLNVSRISNYELEKITELTNLTQLNLGDNFSILEDLKPLTKLKSLKQLSLDLKNTDVTELEPLSELTNLTQLHIDLRYSRVTDLEPLSRLTNLTQFNLDLYGFQINNIKSLFKLTNLTQFNVDLDYSKVSDLEALSKLSSHIELNLKLYRDQGNDLEPLTRLPNLTRLNLDLSSSKIMDLKSLNKLSNLTQLELNIEKSKVSDLTPLTELKNLTQLSLNLNYSEVTDIENLSNLSNLSILDLYFFSNEVKDLTPLLKLNCQTLRLGFDNKKRSLKAIPKNVTHLKF